MAISKSAPFRYPATVSELLALRDVPVVAIDQQGLITFVNKAFEKSYGWSGDELVNGSVTNIMPSHMRNAHNVGFSRYLATEQATLLGTPLMLSIQFKDGRVADAEHYILGDKIKDGWRFAAIIRQAA